MTRIIRMEDAFSHPLCDLRALRGGSLSGALVQRSDRIIGDRIMKSRTPVWFCHAPASVLGIPHGLEVAQTAVLFHDKTGNAYRPAWRREMVQHVFFNIPFDVLAANSEAASGDAGDDLEARSVYGGVDWLIWQRCRIRVTLSRFKNYHSRAKRLRLRCTDLLTPALSSVMRRGGCPKDG